MSGSASEQLLRALAEVLPDEEVDHAAVLYLDLQRIMGRIGYVALRWEDAGALLRSAHGDERPDAAMLVRVSVAVAEGLAAAPGLRLISTNAVSPQLVTSDHGGNSTGVDPERPP